MNLVLVIISVVLLSLSAWATLPISDQKKGEDEATNLQAYVRVIEPGPHNCCKMDAEGGTPFDSVFLSQTEAVALKVKPKSKQ